MSILSQLWNIVTKSPMEPNQAKIAICIGHSRSIGGKRDGGATSVTGVSEWAYNRELGRTLQEKLLAEGIKSFIVDSYRGNGYTDSMKWLASHLKAEGATHALELHFNAAAGTARGHEVLYWNSSEKGQKMAIYIENNFRRWFPEQIPRGAKSRSSGDRGGEFLKLTHCPSVIVEPFFGDNVDDWTYFSKVDNQYLLAGCIAQALKEAIA
jgi:N-acetylmuramoyl-L-alanine amidase